MEILVLFFLLFIVVGIWSVVTYNKLQSGKQQIVEQASNMQVSLQKRRDLASRVIDIAQGFGDHEKLTHMKVSESKAISMESLTALSQNFPELKANETYIKLMNQIEELENNISNKREGYNKTVRLYNTYRSGFPTMLIANKLKFEIAPYYDAANEDCLSELATFTRDDAAAVKELLSHSSQSLKNSALNAKITASNQIEKAMKSDVVKSVVNQSDAVIEKTVEIAKSKAEELSGRSSETERGKERAN